MTKKLIVSRFQQFFYASAEQHSKELRVLQENGTWKARKIKLNQMYITEDPRNMKENRL